MKRLKRLICIWAVIRTGDRGSSGLGHHSFSFSSIADSVSRYDLVAWRCGDRRSVLWGGFFDSGVFGIECVGVIHGVCGVCCGDKVVDKCGCGG